MGRFDRTAVAWKSLGMVISNRNAIDTSLMSYAIVCVCDGCVHSLLIDSKGN